MGGMIVVFVFLEFIDLFLKDFLKDIDNMLIIIKYNLSVFFGIFFDF